MHLKSINQIKPFTANTICDQTRLKIYLFLEEKKKSLSIRIEQKWQTIGGGVYLYLKEGSPMERKLKVNQPSPRIAIASWETFLQGVQLGKLWLIFIHENHRFYYGRPCTFLQLSLTLAKSCNSICQWHSL